MQTAVQEIKNEEGEVLEYFSCPLLFIGKSVREFMAMRKHLKDHPHTAVPYFDQDPRYVAFDDYFSARLAEFENLMEHTGGIG